MRIFTSWAHMVCSPFIEPAWLDRCPAGTGPHSSPCARGTRHLLSHPEVWPGHCATKRCLTVRASTVIPRRFPERSGHARYTPGDGQQALVVPTVSHHLHADGETVLVLRCRQGDRRVA